MKVFLTILFIIFNLALFILFPFWGIATILGVIVGAIAKHKGRDFFSWWFYGTFVFIIALPHILFVQTNHKSIEKQQLTSGLMKKCNYCAELIKKEAKICRYCSKEVIDEKTVSNTQINTSVSLKKKQEVTDEEAKKHANRILKKMRKDQTKTNNIIVGVAIIILFVIGYYFKSDIQGFFENQQTTFTKNKDAGKYTFTQTLELTEYDISGYSKQELRLIRNEIFARYGFIFKPNSELDIYFRNQDWYQENPNFTYDLLSDIERNNVKVIKQVEDAK